MQTPEAFAQPDRAAFGADPFGYSALAWHKWAMAQTVAGFPVDPSVPPTSSDLKSPVLWLAQAHALTEVHALFWRIAPLGKKCRTLCAASAIASTARSGSCWSAIASKSA
jgi:hypothetical protein